MFKWTAFPFIRIALCLIVGIVLYDQYPFLWDTWEFVLPIFLSVCIVAHIIFFRPLIIGVLSLSFIVYLGGLMTGFSDETSLQNHYSRYDHVDGFVGKVISDNTERDRYQRYEMTIEGVYLDSLFYPVSGNIYCYIKKDSGFWDLPVYGDILMVNKSYFPVAAPKNPHEFNYQQYLKRQGIYSHAFISHDNIKKVDHQPEHIVLAWAYGIRTYVKNQIETYIEAPRERAILTALLVGIKDYLDEDTKVAYASAGAMHVLAVSGLHVGIIFILLSWIFKRWKETPTGSIVFVFLAVAVIWMYALITGFSPSVLRAVTMFSVIIISSGFARRANIYNSLGLAACVLITLNPYIIYAVGFQLSFAAVLGIVLIQPRLYRLLEFDYQVPDYLWSITCVSIAAQVATFPLTMLYFHQFPTYFLVSNLLVIPAAVVMLVLGIAMSALGAIWIPAGEIIGLVLEKIVWSINEVIDSLQYLPKPIFDWLYFDVGDTILVYTILLFGLLALIKYNFQFLMASFVASLILIGWFHIKEWEQFHQQEIIFYEIDGVTAIDLVDGKYAQLLIDDYQDQNKEVIAFQVDPNRLARGLPKSENSWEYFEDSKKVYHHQYFDLFRWSGYNIALVRGGKVWQDTLEADIVYFKSKDDFHSQIKADVVILGTDFSFYEARNISESLEEQGFLVHVLSEHGYWSNKQLAIEELAINSLQE